MASPSLSSYQLALVSNPSYPVSATPKHHPSQSYALECTKLYYISIYPCKYKEIPMLSSSCIENMSSFIAKFLNFLGDYTIIQPQIHKLLIFIVCLNNFLLKFSEFLYVIHSFILQLLPFLPSSSVSDVKNFPWGYYNFI